MEFCSVYHEIKAPTNRQYGKPEITGKVVFTPDLQKGEVWTDDGVVVPALPITCHVIDGKMYDKNGEYPSRYVNLMAGGPTANPSSMHWRVSYHDMRVGDEHFYIEPFIFKAIPYVKVNLADVTPVAGYTPPGIIRGGTGSPGLGIIFKGVVLAHEDLPVDGVEDNHAYAITTTKELAVWQGDGWLFVPNFAGIDVNLEDISDWHYEARKNVEFSRAQLEEMEELRALAEKYAESGYDYMKMSMASADGKSSIFYGSDEPESPKEGDTWFKDTEDGSVIIMQYVDGTWVVQVDVDAMDKRLKENERIINVELKDALADLDEQLKNLDAVTALEVVDKLATLETKLAEADVLLKQELQGELAALDEALSGDLTTKLAGLKGDLEAASAARAEAVATAFVQLENRLKAADKAVKDDLVAQLADLESDLAALDTSVGENLTAKLSALRTELLNADTAVNDELVGKLATLKTQLQNADTALTSTLRGELATLKTQLQNADEAVTTDLATRLENTRKALKDASDTIAKDLAEVDSVVSRQRPGNLFPDPFFEDNSWAGGPHTANDGVLILRASGVQTGRYYKHDQDNYPMQFERGASYLMTADVRFSSTAGIDYVSVYARIPKADGTRIWVNRIGQLDRVNAGPGKNSYVWAPTSGVLTISDDMGSGTGTIGFFLASSHPDGEVEISNVRLVRAADNSLIVDGAVTAAKVQAGVIEADHIAAGAIETEKLAADSVVAGKIATNAVVAKNIKAEQITTAKLAADAVTAVKIAADAILARNIKAGQITTAKIAADAVTANEIASGTILADNIKADQITTAKIAADAVTANKVAADAILARNIKAGQITTAKIAADAVTANKVAADAILARNIKTDQILAKHVKAGQITTAKIAAGAVTADELQAENATIDKLWANGIAAKSVTTNRILVANNGNMLPEISSYMGSKYPNLDPYAAFGKNSSDPSMWLKGDNVNATIDHAVNMVAGQKYRFSYQARASVNGTKHYISMHKGNSEKKNVPTETFRNYIGSNTSTSSYVITNGTIDKAWKTFEVEITPEASGFAYFYIFANHRNGTTNPDYQWFKDVRLEKMTGATLIEDGAITTDKIAANAVTANAIKADAVTANAIKAGEVAAKHLAADAVSATKLLAEDATIEKLWANGLAAKSITASRLTVSPGNMFPDPNFEDASWGHGTVNRLTNGISLTANGTQKGVYLQPEGQANASMQHTPGVNYLLTANLRFGGNANISKFSVYARMERDTGVFGATKVGEFVRFPTDGQEHASYRHRDNSTVLDFSSIKMAPGGYFTLGFFVERTEPSGSVEIRNVRLTPMSGTTLIEDGAITTGKVAANAITANEIKAGEVKAKHINSGEITSDKLTVENGFIKNAMIGNGEITDAKIGSLDAGKITAGYLNANRIESGTIKTAHIGANQITTNKIAAGAIKADQIDANAITGDKLEVGTIKADRIEAKVFTQVATSVLPLIPGTVDPTWTDGLRYVARSGTKDAALPAGIPGYYRDPSGTIAAGDKKGVYNTYNNVVSIDPNLEYEASWWVRSSAGSPRFIYVTLEDQNGNTDIVQRVDGTDSDGNDHSQHTWGNPIRVIITSASTTWKKYKTLFTFKEGTKSIRIHNVYFDNSTNSSAAYLYIAGLEISPSIAKKSDVDAIQDKQIEDNKKRVGEIGALSAELERRTVGMVPVKADRMVRSTTHGAGVSMPSYDRYTNLYLSPSFTGTVVFQVFYVYSLVDNKTGHSYQWFFDHTEFKLQPASNLNSYFAPLAEGGKIRHLQFRVPEGNVDQALLLLDHMDWNRG